MTHMKKITIGMLAHVDAGKTTLTESFLYLSKKIRSMGRVDNGNTFLDYDKQERQRGITIFSKQVIFNYGDTQFFLLDTPGHVDFSSEMERTLSILDYGIMIISALDGVQSHTKTIFELLKLYRKPCFIFVNKMDVDYVDRQELLKDLQQQLDVNCLDMEDEESLACHDEKLLSRYLATNQLDTALIADDIAKRRLFPVYFGSALKLMHIEQFMQALSKYTLMMDYPEAFKAQIYKISYEANTKLAHMKITGGSLKVKAYINDEKVDQIRLYDGAKYSLTEEATAGSIVVIKGLDKVYAGMGLGAQADHKLQLSSYMRYELLLDKACDPYQIYRMLQKLQDEDPSLQLSYDQGRIYLSLMGEVQTEILTNMIKERLGIDVSFGKGKISYGETITKAVEGVGHFEPLRHYAEVHLLLEPIDKGLEFVNAVGNNDDMHYQNVIMNYLQSMELRGILTNSPLMNIKITLLGFKAHLKHSEPNDFKEACQRAVRHGLMRTNNVLLEPYYDFVITCENVHISKVLFELEQRQAQFVVNAQENDHSIIKGEGSMAKLLDMPQELLAYTKGTAKINLDVKGYQPCDEQEKIIDKYAYDPEGDAQNPSGSIFCKQGAGFYVAYQEVERYMHLPYLYQPVNETSIPKMNQRKISDAELQRVWNNTYRSAERNVKKSKQKQDVFDEYHDINSSKPKCLLVDGYNVIFGWDDLKKVANANLDLARSRLLDRMAEYQAYRYDLLIVVFDAYKLETQKERAYEDHNIFVVYTKGKETADTYIEKAVGRLNKDYLVTVATSDNLEQLTIMQQKAHRMSVRELQKDYALLKRMLHEKLQKERTVFYNHSLQDIMKYFQED